MNANKEAATWLEHPVLIAGHRKAGTTLLLNLLDSHPELCVFPSDSGFFYGYYPLYDDPSCSFEDRKRRVIEVMIGNLRNNLHSLGTSPEPVCCDDLSARFEAFMDQRQLSAPNLLQAMIQAYAMTRELDQGALRQWVEKTTSSEIYAAEVFEWFPRARFIHVIRDPRDNYASLKSGWRSRYQQYNDSVERLLQSVLERGLLGMRLAHLNRERFGAHRYHVVRFEDLTNQPREVMHAVARFCDVTADPVLLRPTFCGVPWTGNNFEGLQFDAPDPVNVGRWHQRISAHEARVIEFYFEDVMRIWGYVPEFNTSEQMDAAREHYKWHNFAQHYSVVSGAETFGKALVP